MDKQDDFSKRDAHTLGALDNFPLEILSRIMLMVPPKRPHPRQTPTEVQLSHVSSRWRAAALNMPHLWTNIRLYSSRSFISTSSYLRRSGTLTSLNVQIDVYFTDKAHGTRNGSATIDAFVA